MNRNKKDNKSNYIILCLISLIILNMFVLTRKLNGDESRNKNIVGTRFFNRILSIKNFSSRTFNKNVDPIEDNFIMLEDINIEDEIESQEDDILIQNFDEYDNLIIVKDSTGTSSIENIPDLINIKKAKVNKEDPYIFIYHTHATEGYLPFEGQGYSNINNSKNVVAAGATMSKVLEANNHKVMHNQTHHDMPSYNMSYSRSLTTLNKVKEEENNLQFFFDIHRDGVEKDAPYYDKFLKTSKIEIDGKSVATFELVIGPGNPNYDELLGFANYIKAVSDALYPGLCKGILIKPIGKYNLFVSDYTALIELGSNLNTIDEANESAKYVGEILSLVIDSIVE